MKMQTLAIQRDYPQIYLACHTEHTRRRTSPGGISSHDSTVLAHIDREGGVGAGLLAKHLGVAPSSLSAAIKRLVDHGYVETQPGVDRRRKRLVITAKGRIAMSQHSVLDAARVSRLLASLSADERRRACEGLSLLAKAAARLARREERG